MDPPAPAAPVTAGHVRVLIAEDDDDTCESLVDLLASEGFVPYGVRNGKEALHALQFKNAFDVVLLDYMMPVYSGFYFLQRYDGDLPVVLMTGYTKFQEMPKQPWAILFKPVQVPKLLEVLKRAAESRKKAGNGQDQG